MCYLKNATTQFVHKRGVIGDLVGELSMSVSGRADMNRSFSIRSLYAEYSADASGFQQSFPLGLCVELVHWREILVFSSPRVLQLCPSSTLNDMSQIDMPALFPDAFSHTQLVP